MNKIRCFKLSNILDFLKDNLSNFYFTLLSTLILIFIIIRGENVLSSQYLIFIPLIISATPIFINTLEEVFLEKKISSNFLITLAMVSALMINERMAAAEVVVIMALGENLENYTIKRSKKTMYSLLLLKPQYAFKITSRKNEKGEILEEIHKIKIENIKIGDLVRVKAGEIIPIDGIVVKGESTVDQSIVTGESLPIVKNINSSVFSATQNCEGILDIKCTALNEDSTLSKMLNLIEIAEKEKAPLQKIADIWSSKIVFMSISFAIFTYFFHFFNNLDQIFALKRAVTILLVFCPCAFVLATPTAIIAAIGQASKKGIFIKSGKALEELAKIDTIFFDKTGTLTEGNLSLKNYFSVTNNKINFQEDLETKNSILKEVANLENYSEHPIAQAILKKAKEENYTAFKSLQAIENLTGLGMIGKDKQETIFVGNEKLMLKNNISLSDEINNFCKMARERGEIVVYLAKKDKDKDVAFLKGLFFLHDNLRNEARESIKNLKFRGLNPILLTGDQEQTASYIAKETNIDIYQASCLPIDKVNYIKNYQKAGHKCLMIGDGINDAPALKIAEVGIAMGEKGNDISVEAADLTLMKSDLSKLSYVYQLAKETVKSIKFNMLLALTINFVALILSFLGILTPISGALFHNIGSILVVLNASYLYQKKIKV